MARPRRQGTGLRAADRSRHDARPDGQRARSTASSSTASICSCSIRTSASIRPTTTLKQLADKHRARGLVVGSLVAPVWPPTGGGSAMGSDEERKTFVTQVRKACAIGKKLRELGIRQYGVVRIDSAASPADWAKDPGRQHEEDRRDLPRGRATSPRTTASGSPPKAKSAGAACTAGSACVELLEAGRPAGDARLPGRHGAHAALHAGLQRAGGSPPAGELRLVATTTTLDDALRDDDAARCGRGRSTSTSRRTTPRSRAPARTTRPAATACRTIRTASSTSSSTPATGCATTAGKPTRAVRAHLLGRLHVPERHDDASRRPGTTSSAR